MREKQGGAARPLWSPIPSPNPSQALGKRLTRLDHRSTPFSLSWCYPGGGGQAHKNGTIHSYHEIHGSTRGGLPLLTARGSPSRPSSHASERQGSCVHVAFLEAAVGAVRHSGQPLHGIPPPNGRGDGAVEFGVGTIPPHL